jgi:Cytochrome P450
MRPNNRHILDKLTEEIRSNFASDADLKFEDLTKLPYLTAVIEEGLRIFPSAPIGFVRTVPQGGDTVVGEAIPEGVSLNSVCMKVILILNRPQYLCACGRQHTVNETSVILIFSDRKGGWTKIMLRINCTRLIRSRLVLEVVLGESKSLSLTVFNGLC